MQRIPHESDTTDGSVINHLRVRRMCEAILRVEAISEGYPERAKRERSSEAATAGADGHHLPSAILQQPWLRPLGSWSFSASALVDESLHDRDGRSHAQSMTRFRSPYPLPLPGWWPVHFGGGLGSRRS